MYIYFHLVILNLLNKIEISEILTEVDKDGSMTKIKKSPIIQSDFPPLKM